MPNVLGPLGLLLNVTRNTSKIAKVKVLAEFDMSREREVVPKRGELKIEDHLIPVAEREFKRFFSLGLLVSNPKYAFVPTPQVDAIWHELIIDTERYAKICQDVHGGFIHHRPLGPEAVASNAGEVSGTQKR